MALFTSIPFNFHKEMTSFNTVVPAADDLIFAKVAFAEIAGLLVN